MFKIYSNQISNLAFSFLSKKTSDFIKYKEDVQKGYFTAKVTKVSQRYAKIKYYDLMLCDPLRNFVVLF